MNSQPDGLATVISFGPGTVTTEQSNAFLRAVWAELRSEFGRPGWYFTPGRDGEAKEISFGSLSLGPDVYDVAVKYSTRGSIDVLRFSSSSSAQPQHSARLGEAIRRAYARRSSETEHTFVLRLAVSRPYTLHHYSSERWSIWPCEEGSCLMIVQSMGFDRFDARVQALKTGDDLCQLLTAFTNVDVQLTSSRLKAQEQAIFKAVDDISQLAAPPSSNPESHDVVERPTEPSNHYWSEPGWIDDIPLVKGKLALTRDQQSCVTRHVDGGTDATRRLVRAARHFARGAYLQTRLTDFDDVGTAILVSALEAIDPGEGGAAACKYCGQQIHRISKRVQDLAARHTNETVARIIKGFYNDRSAFLHTGASRRLLPTEIVPQLDLADPSGCVRHNATPYHLQEFVSFILRAECAAVEARYWSAASKDP